MYVKIDETQFYIMMILAILTSDYGTWLALNMLSLYSKFD